MRYIDILMLLVAGLLMTGCGSDEGNGDSEKTTADRSLDICVYAPGPSITSRADAGEIVPAKNEESEVHSLHIWVFKSSDGSLVSYLHPTTSTYLNEAPYNETYKMAVTNAFADNPENVDVYVVANEGSIGLTLDESTTRDQLDKATISNNYFGVSANYSDQTTDGKDIMVKEVPAGGLPMSAVMRNQPITGKFPTLRIGTDDGMATLQLTRAVSKLRFVLCRVTESESTTKKFKSINSIQLDKDQIPTTSWLIKRETNDYTYSHDAINFGGLGEKDLNKNYQLSNPQDYTYEAQKEKKPDLTAQEYEDIINKAIRDGVPEKEGSEYKAYFKEFGLTYLRESDLQLTGTINYTYLDGSTSKTEDAEFSMAAPGDFLRNHSWLVYIYYMDAKIYVLTVTDIGMRAWTPYGNTDPTVYNW